MSQLSERSQPGDLVGMSYPLRGWTAWWTAVCHPTQGPFRGFHGRRISSSSSCCLLSVWYALDTGLRGFTCIISIALSDPGRDPELVLFSMRKLKLTEVGLLPGARGVQLEALESTAALHFCEPRAPERAGQAVTDCERSLSGILESGINAGRTQLFFEL